MYIKKHRKKSSFEKVHDLADGFMFGTKAVARLRAMSRVAS